MNIQRTIASPDGEDYETDFHAWLGAQAEALRARDPSLLDWNNLIEEVEALGSSERRELDSRLATIVEHLLKFHYGLNREPEAGWKKTIRTQRRDLDRHLRQSPSLRRHAQDSLKSDYEAVRTDTLASFEQYEPVHLPHYRAAIPSDLPYTLDQILDLDWLPEPAGSS